MRRTSTLLAVALLAAQAPAQVPNGHYVISSFRLNATSALGGLAIVHPRTPMPATAIAGLPDELTGNGFARTGANCVTYSPADGFLIVGEIASVGQDVELHELVVSGGSVVFDFETVVGVSAGADGSISQIALLPNGDAVFAVAGLVNAAPLFGQPLGYFDRATRTVTPIPVLDTWGYPNALAVDATGATLYAFDHTSATVYTLPITGGAPTVVAPAATTFGTITGMAVDPGGDLLVSYGQVVERVDVQTGTRTLVANLGTFLNGLFLERATASAVVVQSGGAAQTGVFRVDGATPLLLAANISGCGSGVAVVDSPRGYGVPTPGAATYAFRTFPATGGVPIAGNPAFTIEVEAIGGPGTLFVLAGSLAPASFPALGVQVLLDPQGSVVVGPFAPGAPVPFPIPPGLPPVTAYLQSFHLDAANPGGLASTAGLLLGTIQ